MDAWIDLTKPLDETTAIYAEGPYRDPNFAAELWASHAAHGYEVWRLELGTQSGTHIDAPRHFDLNGVTIDALRPEECMGSYRLVTVDDLSPTSEGPQSATAMCHWNGVTALVLDARPTGLTSSPQEPSHKTASAPRMLTTEAVEAVATCPCRLIVVIGEPSVAHSDPFYFHRRLAECGKFLVEDTREDSGILPREGQIVALPMRFTGLSGSPVRVLIRGTDSAK